ncbi:unnamed protein product [Cercopithifilaria johnstoni]|uniref:Inositol-1-monophosphatase n=1 Tax=Cercopithifilaria johnstoni TaxID=2874296 RepID=A0A8J2M082_9BILA|nr:unnamed protein product [Cercopithifilaria johnstoni]
MNMSCQLLHPDEDKFFTFALNLVNKAGTLVRTAFEQPCSKVHTKMSDTDLVTETDQAVEKMLIENLSKEFPDHKFIGEESVAGGAKIDYTDAPTWIIDPIDGTTNFVHRIPIIAICVGLAIKKQLRAGIVYNPITKELYTAQSGRGAFRNGFPIHVSSTKEISRCLIGQSHGIHNLAQFGEKWLKITMDNHGRQCLAGIRGHRSFGSAAMNMVYVAQGILDAYVEYGLHAWDVAAAGIIVKEAGGMLLDPAGAEFDIMNRRVLCTSTPELAKAIKSTLSHVEYEKEG